MRLTRRDLAAAGVLALGASTLIRPAQAEAADEAAINQAVEGCERRGWSRIRRNWRRLPPRS